MADDSVNVYLPKDIRARLPELMQFFNVNTPSKAIRKAIELQLRGIDFRKLHPPPTPRVIEAKYTPSAKEAQNYEYGRRDLS